jgi:hypothetical protein
MLGRLCDINRLLIGGKYAKRLGGINCQGNSDGIVVVIGKSASPWLTVGKANGDAPSDKVASVETVRVGRQL